MKLDRIESNPQILNGKPIIKGTRISVAMILEWLASGASHVEILSKYPHLHKKDIRQSEIFR